MRFLLVFLLLLLCSALSCSVATAQQRLMLELDNSDNEILYLDDTGALRVGGSATGITLNNTAVDADPYLAFALSGTNVFTIGVDDTDDAFQIGTTGVDSSVRVIIDSSGNTAFAQDVYAGGTNTSDSAHLLRVSGSATFNNQAIDQDIVFKASGILDAIFLQGSDGFLGLRTQTPSEQLHVVGNAIITGTTGLNGITYTWPVSDAARMLKSDGAGALSWSAVDLGTAEITGTLPVGNGGTGATSLTDGGILLGSGTGAITALGVAANGEIPIGDGTTDPVLATITGGTNATVSNGAGSITVDVDDAFLVNDADDTTTGNITINKADPSLIFDVTTATDTDFWLGVTDDAGGDDDDKFQIGDGATPGTNPFVTIDTAGKVGIGDPIPASRLHVATTSTAAARGIIDSQHWDGADGARLILRKSRGVTTTPGAGDIVQTGDVLGRIFASGWDGANYLQMGRMSFAVEGTVAATRVPTRFTLSTATNAAPSVLTPRFSVDSAGNTGFGSGVVSATIDGLVHLDAGTSNTSLILERDAGTSAAIRFHKAGTENGNIRMSTADDITIENDQLNRDINFIVNDGGVDTNVMNIDGTFSRIGAGTLTPLRKLHFVDDTQSTVMLLESATGAGVQIAMKSDESGGRTWRTGVGLDAKALFTIYDEDAGLSRMIIDTAGRISIGNADNVGTVELTPDTELEIDGAITFKEISAPSVAADKAALYVRDDGGGDTALYVKFNSGEKLIQSEGSSVIGTPQSEDLQIRTSNVARITIQADGTVVIGGSGPIGAPSFTGTGADDLFAIGGFTGGSNLTYRVEIDGAAPDTFRWSDAGGAPWDAEGVVITGAAQTLNNGVQVNFDNITSKLGEDIFFGSIDGLDDLTRGGTYTGLVDVTYRVEIDLEGTPDTFRWSDDGGMTWDVEDVAITGGAQSLNNGVTVTFGATTGHTLSEYWEFTATASKHVVGDFWDFTASTQTTELLKIQDYQDNDLFVIENNGDTAIGHSTPTRRLHVIDDTTATTALFSSSSLAGSQIALDGTETNGREWRVGTGINGPGRFSLFDVDAVATRMEILTDGKVGFGTTAPNQLVSIAGTMSLLEQAAANADTAAYGQLWVKNTTPNELWFTDDAGTDFQLGAGGGGGSPGGSDTQIQYNNAGAFGGMSTVITDGSGHIRNTEFQEFQETSTPATPGANIAKLYSFDEDGKTRLGFITPDDTEVTLAQDSFYVATNKSGGTVNPGEVLRISGASGSLMDVELAKADAASTMPAILMCIDSVGNNATGRFLVAGVLRNIDTSSFNEGDVLYVSAATAGQLTATAPSPPNLVQRVGVVIRSHGSLGSIAFNTGQIVYPSTGNDGEVQYNNAGVFGAMAGVAWDDTANELTMTAQAADDVPLKIKGAVSQTANLQQWQNSAGTVGARITKDREFSNINNGSSEQFGTAAVASGTNSFAAGNTAIASGIQSTAVGRFASAAGTNFTSLGTNAGLSATGTDKISIGFEAGKSSTGNNTIFVGNNTGNSAGSSSETVRIGADGAASDTSSRSVLVGWTPDAANKNEVVTLGAWVKPTAENQFISGSENVNGTAIFNVFFGHGVTSTTASTAAYTINGTGGSGTNIAGGNITIAGGKGTGNAAGGHVIFSTADEGGSGSTLQSLTEKMRLHEDGDLLLGTTAVPSAGSGKVMAFGDNGGDPTMGTDTAGVYANDVAGTVELFTVDEAGNTTQQTPHDANGEWIFYSENTKTGKKVRIRMEVMMKFLAEKFADELPEDVFELGENQ